MLFQEERTNMNRTISFAASLPIARAVTAIATIFLCAAVASPVFAESVSLEDRVRQLEDLVRKQGDLLEKQQQRIEQQHHIEQPQHIEEQQEQLDAQDGPAAPATNATASPEQKFEIKTGNNGLRISSADGKFKFGVGGRDNVDRSLDRDHQAPVRSVEQHLPGRRRGRHLHLDDEY